MMSPTLFKLKFIKPEGNSDAIEKGIEMHKNIDKKLKGFMPKLSKRNILIVMIGIIIFLIARIIVPIPYRYIVDSVVGFAIGYNLE